MYTSNFYGPQNLEANKTFIGVMKVMLLLMFTVHAHLGCSSVVTALIISSKIQTALLER